MIAAASIPPPPLSDYVACIWFQADYCPSHSQERALPDGYVELVINIYEDCLLTGSQDHPYRLEQASGSLIYGPRTKFFVIDTAIPVSILGVHFKPGGAFPFFGLPVDELHNCIVPLEIFWGYQVECLREQLQGMRTPAEQIRVMEKFLTAQISMSRHPAVDCALRLFTSPFSPPKIAEVQDRLGLSSRYVSLLFREQVGITPKAYHRLCRFQSALQLISQTEQPDWAALALECGYFDQSHFIHDFKAFSGLTPLEYHLQEGKRPGHVPIPDDN